MRGLHQRSIQPGTSRDSSMRSTKATRGQGPGASTSSARRRASRSPSAQARYHSIVIEGRELRWERHTEIRLLHIRLARRWPQRTDLAAPDRGPGSAGDRRPACARIAIAVKPLSQGDGVAEGPDVCSSLVMGGRARVSTDFHADEHGFVRFEIAHADMSADELGTLSAHPRNRKLSDDRADEPAARGATDGHARPAARSRTGRGDQAHRRP